MKKIVYLTVVVLATVLFSSCSNTPKKENESLNEVVKSSAEPFGPVTEVVDLNDYSQVLYINGNVENEGTGTKESPCKTIGQALAKVKDAGEKNRTAILVAAGTYAEPTIQVQPWVDFFGGFAGQNWERNIVANTTTLSGISGSRIMIAAEHCIIDGFTFTKAVYRGKGAAIYGDKVSPVISNNSFVTNKTLGPQNWHPKFWHETANNGGAVYFSNGSNTVIKNNLFAGNRTENGRGGALAFDNKCTPKIINNVFVNNITGLNDQMRSSDGGAISVFDRCNATVVNNYFLSNQALDHNDAGGIFVALWSSARIKDNVFVDNYADDDAGAIFVGGQEHRYDDPLDPIPSKDEFYVTIDHNTVIGNRNSSMNSGAMRFTMESRGEVTNNITAFNNGIYFQRSEVAVSHNTILDNFLFIETKEGLELGSITNNVIWGAYNQEIEATVEGNKIREKNLDRLNFVNDGKELSVLSTNMDKGTYETHMLVNGIDGCCGDYCVGRVVKAGNNWGIVKSCEGNSMTIWGNFLNVLHLTVLPSYTIEE